jgi:SAM-dependent methyltransferase
MESAQLDPAEFRSSQEQQWGKVSSGWRKWSDLIESESWRVSERLVELAEVGPGGSVLDVGAGYGEPSLTAATEAGPEGRVVATDISTEMMAFGSERAAAAGVDNVEFVRGDAASLDFPDDSFDAALSRWGIIFEPDAEEAAGRIRRFLRPGGKMAISSWGPPEKVPMLGLPMMTALKYVGAEPPPPDTPGPLSRPTPEAVGGLVEAGGFEEVEVEEMELNLEWDSPEEFTTFIREIVPPINAIIDPEPEEVQAEAWQAITDAARGHTDEDGRVKLKNLALLAAGRA